MWNTEDIKNLRNTAVRSLVGPKGQFSLSAEGLLTYHDNPEKSDHITLRVTEEQIITEMTRIQAEYDAQEYARARQPLYPDIGDQLDDLYHKGAFSAEMIAKLKKVKDDNPK